MANQPISNGNKWKPKWNNLLWEGLISPIASASLHPLLMPMYHVILIIWEMSLFERSLFLNIDCWCTPLVGYIFDPTNSDALMFEFLMQEFSKIPIGPHAACQASQQKMRNKISWRRWSPTHLSGHLRALPLPLESAACSTSAPRLSGLSLPLASECEQGLSVLELGRR